MARLRVPAIITITDISSAGDAERRFVVTNEATGRYFAANQSTVKFLQVLRRTGQAGLAAAEAGILPHHANTLVEKLAQFGVVLMADQSAETSGPKAPIEGKLISLKADLGNAARLAERLAWLGRLMFAWPSLVVGLVVWAYAISVLAENTDKIAASFRQLAQLNTSDLILFGILFVALKLVHELGHILAYRTMCHREGLNPGPIRVGLMVFAGSPFPYTDVTGAWRITSRLRRAAIGAGGIYFELWTVAPLIILWAHLDLGSFEVAIVQVAVVSGAMTVLFNLNPLIKLDGYYILTDLFGIPNLSGRASQSAKASLAHLLGDTSKPVSRGALIYWILSYAYRWTIFAGIFWLAYRFDPRLATIAGIVSVLLLIVRPLLATLRPIRGAISMVRTTLTLGVLGLALVAMSVPFENRLLVVGQLNSVRSEFVRPPETVRVADGVGATLAFELPDLAHDIKSLEVRAAVLEVLSRSPGLSASEQAALATDASANAKRLDDLELRQARLVPDVAAAQLFPGSIDEMRGQWIRAEGTPPLLSIGRESAPYLSLRVPQARLTETMPQDMRVRLASHAGCEFDAQAAIPWVDAVVDNGQAHLEASPGQLPACANDIPSGSAVVARLALPPASILERLRVRARSLLQDRLPFEANPAQTNG